MVIDQGLAKVLDFGLAKQCGQPSAHAASSPARRIAGVAPDAADALSHWTIQGALRGTPRYMSPEQAAGQPLDHRSDFFSFGVMLYEMLGGFRPFAGETIVDLLTAIALETPKPLSEVNPEVPALLSQIVERCLAKKPEDRYPDCASVLGELEKLALDGQGSSPAPTTPEAERPAPEAEPPARGEGRQEERPRRRSSLAKAGLAAGLLVLFGIAAAGAWHRGSPPPLAALMPAPRPTAITDLPLPASPNADAIAAYKAALASMRHGDWGQARADLRRALAIDPLMAAAHLRLAQTLGLTHATAAESRASYARAVQGRASLSERDQVLLWALEPALNFDPPSKTLAAARLREAMERYPLDAEFFYVIDRFLGSDHEAALVALKRATELDPQYADVWQATARRLTRLNRIEEGLAALDQCVKNSPASIDCRGGRASLYRSLGRCAEMEEEFRRAISTNPKAALSWYDGWASAVYSLGRPREVVLEALAQKWAQEPEEKRRPMELLDRARLDFDAGRFSEAEARAREGSRLIEADRNAVTHGDYARLLIRIHRETGRLGEAAKVADDYLKRKEVWQAWEASDPRTMPMLRTLLHAGALSKEAFASKREEWVAGVPERDSMAPDMLWFYAYASEIERPDEVEEAIVALTKLAPGSPSPMVMQLHGAVVGKVYLLAGRVDEALPLLRLENQRCAGPGRGYLWRFDLGQALEQTGDSSGACAAYQVVLDHWGKARPRSITAAKARARVKALGCGVRKPGAAPSR
jgi:serine/threonine-protein kinase